MNNSMQMDLFAISKEPFETYLHIVMNGISTNIKYDELFNSEKFDTLKAITYVSSPNFFSKIIKGYKKVDIIIGIENTDVSQAFAQGVNEIINVRGTDFFKGLDDSTKEKVCDDIVSIRYADIGKIIHSKIYLLSHSKTGERRIVFGSANLTESAFNSDIHQYEDICVFDNDGYYEVFEKRFNAIYQSTIDYIPQSAKEKFKKEKAYYIDDEEKAELIVEELMKRGGTIVFPEEITQKIALSYETNERTNTEYQITTKIINQVTRKKDNNLISKSKTELLKIKPIIKELVVVSNKAAKEISRFSLFYNEYERRIDSQKKYDDGTTKAFSYCLEANSEQIKYSLDSIEKFISAYSTFTTNPDENNLAKVYEVILYAFMSVFLFKIREDYGLEVGKPEKREDIPVFLIIGGRAKAGKSSLLTFISKLLGNNTINDYLQYKDIDKLGVLEGLFSEQNVFPILVDEMAEKFFNSTAKSKGEIFIKHIANSQDGKHPALITTTNTKHFNVPEQVLRRVYYLQIDKTFDDTKKAEADTFFIDLISQIDNTLFMDFCNRVCEMIRNGEKLYKDSMDCLYTARNIFKEYYKIVKKDLPKYFPEHPFDDYKVRGKNMWRTILNENPTIFKFNPELDQLTVTLSNIMAEDQKENYLNYIDTACVKEDMGVHTLIRASIFFKWLGVKNPFKKRWWIF